MRNPFAIIGFPLYWVVRHASFRDAALRDVARAATLDGDHFVSATMILGAVSDRAFRTLLYERMYHGTKFERGLAKVLRRVYHESVLFELSCPSIGGGLKLAHGALGSVIRTGFIGEDRMIFQQVTIGNHRGYPHIGNRVRIFPGAMIVGGVDIGDDAVIGPRALVQFDVPAGAKIVAPRGQALERATSFG